MAVKSADRILEILEFFDDTRSPHSVSDIASALGYPQSSTTELLQTLSARGYIYFHQESRRYAPTLLISLLGDWGLASNEAGADILGLIRRLRFIQMGEEMTLPSKLDEK
jgi:DNA-binding IclR family transcriptional regulator